MCSYTRAGKWSAEYRYRHPTIKLCNFTITQRGRNADLLDFTRTGIYCLMQCENVSICWNKITVILLHWRIIFNSSGVSLRAGGPPDLAGYISKIAGYFFPNNNHNMPIFFISFENVIVKLPNVKYLFKIAKYNLSSFDRCRSKLTYEAGERSHHCACVICILSPNTTAVLY